MFYSYLDQKWGGTQFYLGSEEKPKDEILSLWFWALFKFVFLVLGIMIFEIIELL